jgi:hypothetical protein
MLHNHYITTTSDLRLGGSPSVNVESVHNAPPDPARHPGRSILPVWEMDGRRLPRSGERVGTFRDGRTLYAVGNEVTS